ncbi:MAG: hypothetical protein H6728_10580 [Myxococcales bacterium]|nr:hypothetical protein [Myxococcales bacterium]MCB9643504.1 hypothetical protein [Myxococcales bacterium]
MSFQTIIQIFSISMVLCCASDTFGASTQLRAAQIQIVITQSSDTPVLLDNLAILLDHAEGWWVERTHSVPLHAAHLARPNHLFLSIPSQALVVDLPERFEIFESSIRVRGPPSFLS